MRPLAFAVGVLSLISIAGYVLHAQERPVLSSSGGTGVMLRGDGSLAGTVAPLTSPSGRLIPASPMTVSFIQNGRIMASAQTNAQGAFVVPVLRPGSYSVVASGPAGFTAFAVRVLPFVDLGPDAPLPDGVASELQIDSLIPTSDLPAVMSLLPPGAQLPGFPVGSPGAPVGPGGGSPSFGGGGGGGGAGDLGSLLGLAGLGLGAAALLGGDDGGGDDPEPVSRFIPR